MSDDNKFEQRLRNLLQKTGSVDIPPLTQERLESLRTLIPTPIGTLPTLSLVWKQAVNGLSEILALVEASGLYFHNPVAPVLRGDEKHEDDPFNQTISLALPNGELWIQTLPLSDHKAKLLLSIKGRYNESDTLSIELSHGQRLIEARPLEQKAEFTISGFGIYSVALFSENEIIGKLNLKII